jgi:hypothetical protein
LRRRECFETDQHSATLDYRIGERIAGEDIRSDFGGWLRRRATMVFDPAQDLINTGRYKRGGALVMTCRQPR